METVSQELLDGELGKPEWQELLRPPFLQYLYKADFPPSDDFPDGGTTLHFQIVKNEQLLALVEKHTAPGGRIYPPEWRASLLLVGATWRTI